MEIDGCLVVAGTGSDVADVDGVAVPPGGWCLGFGRLGVGGVEQDDRQADEKWGGPGSQAPVEFNVLTDSSLKLNPHSVEVYQSA